MSDDLKELFSEIGKKYGKGAIFQGGSSSIKDIEVIPTGALTLDLATGIGGIARGRIIEIFGPESNGKTTLLLHIIAEAQKLGNRAAFIDVEHALDIEYAARIGVNVDELIVAQPSCGEEALEIVEMIASSGKCAIVGVDSVAALVTKAELDGELSDVHMAPQARLMSNCMRRLPPKCSKSKTSIVFVNQVRSIIGGYGKKENTPGGRALKFYSSMRIEVRRIATSQTKNGDPTGIRVKAKLVKNKLAIPFRIGEFDIIFPSGISQAGCILDLAIFNDLVEKNGSWFSISKDKIRLGQGRPAAILMIDKNLEIFNSLKNQIMEIYKEQESESESENDETGDAETD